MVNPALTHLPPTEANCPPTHCVKPTTHMANYVAANGDFTAPFDALKNAVLPFKKHSFSYVATTNTSSIAESNTYRPKKSPKQAPGHFQHTATALTPEQESAVISRFLETIDQERLQDTDTNNRVNYACELSYEAGSTDMGRSHSLSIKPGAINDIAAAELQDIQDNYARNTFASTIIPRQEDLQLASYERPIKNQRVRFNFNVQTIKIKNNNEVAKCDSFKIPATNAEDLHYDKRGIIQTALKRALQCMSSIKIPTNTRGEIVRTVDCIKELAQNVRFTTPCKREARKSDSDDGITSSEARASHNMSTFLQSPRIGGEQAKTIMAIMDKFQVQNCKFSSECLSKSPELLNPPTSATMMQLPMRLEELHRISFPTLPEKVIPFVRHHNKAVIQHDSILILPVTPPVTTSHLTVSTSIATQNDENTPVHSDAINGPVPHDGIGPMSARDPAFENAVNLNFNEDISDNGLDIDKTPADTTYESADMLTTTIPAQPQTMSAFHHPDTKIYRDSDIKHKKTTQFSVTLPQFLNRKPVAFESCNPFSFLSIAENSHKLHPTTDSASDCLLSTTAGITNLIKTMSQNPPEYPYTNKTPETLLHVIPELHDKELPTFAELESHLLNIDDSCGLTLPSQNQHNYNQHANSAHQPSSSLPFQHQGTTYDDFPPHQQQAFTSSSMMQPNAAINKNRPPNHFQNQTNNLASEHPRRQTDDNDCSIAMQQPQPCQKQHCNTRPHFRHNSANNANQRRPPDNFSSPNAANITCYNCGQLGHYANRCITVNRSQNSNHGGLPNTNPNNDETAPHNQRAYYITDSIPSQSHAFYHQAYIASCNDQGNINCPNPVPSWPDIDTPEQMAINRVFLNDF
ncbi:hypothetical protein MHU86_21303 [Fragilaria crotonensis]|nr:hypothetical protein MHU86_21303 [Fragilaria crotonensis]